MFRHRRRFCGALLGLAFFAGCGRSGSSTSDPAEDRAVAHAPDGLPEKEPLGDDLSSTPLEPGDPKGLVESANSQFDAVVHSDAATMTNSINAPFNDRNPARPSESGSGLQGLNFKDSVGLFSGGIGSGAAGMQAGGSDGDGHSGDGLFRGRSATLARRGGRPALDGPRKPADPRDATWKRSQLVPNSSRLMVGDEISLPLQGLQVDARVEGFRARVMLDYFYLNTHRQALEGTFQLRLPEGATPFFFAFGANGQRSQQFVAADLPKFFITSSELQRRTTSAREIRDLRASFWSNPREARIVPKEQAAHAYQETVRRRVDPALVEWAGAGIFQSRVFPLEAGTLHRIVVGYDVDLLAIGNELEFRLELPELKVPCAVDLSVREMSGSKLTIEPAAEFAKGEGRQTASFRHDNWNGREIKLRVTPPGPFLLRGKDPQTGPYFATRVRPPLPPSPEFKGAGRGVFLVDASLSANPQQFGVWLKLLRSILTENRDAMREFAVLFFNVEAFWWREEFAVNTPENLDAFDAFANQLAIEGATDLGLALAEGASPAWMRKGAAADAAKQNWDLFLLSDAAATWGESDPQAQLRPLKAAGLPLYAYTTGLGGADLLHLAHLTRETGGAMFSVVGDEQLAQAAKAYRTRPWELVEAVVDGGSDLLIRGRPRTLYPDQELMIVGRGSPDPTTASVTLKLRQGEATQEVMVRLAGSLSSELAPRTYGQVAVEMIEELPGQEKTAAAFARQFSVPGQTCSLLMLESEADYQRFDIKPQNDVIMVGQTLVTALQKSMEDAHQSATSDPKTAFLAWLKKLESPLNGSYKTPPELQAALDRAPVDMFHSPTTRGLTCKLRTTKGWPSQLHEQLTGVHNDETGLYDLLSQEAARRLQLHGPHDALRAISSLVEKSPGDLVIARDVSFSALEWQLPGQAYHLLRRVAVVRPHEPQTYNALARCAAECGAPVLAMAYYEIAVRGDWHARNGDVRTIAAVDYVRFLNRLLQSTDSFPARDYAATRRDSLAKSYAPPPGSTLVMITWNTDQTDIDLHVTEPGGEICKFDNPTTKSGGTITRDATEGYGPEMYLAPKLKAGRYEVFAHYFANHANRLGTRTRVATTIYQHWGTPLENVTQYTVRLDASKAQQFVAEFKAANE